MKEKLKHVTWISYLFWLFLGLLSLLGTLKVVLLGADVDEQYAVAMAYRMVRGDRMFLEMWEPHQTSGFLAAFLIKLFLLATGSVDHVVIFLRVAGVLIQFGISFFLYDTMSRFFHRDIALAMSLFFYNTMPKYSPIPEFANMLLWFSVLAFLCLMRFTAGGKRSKLWLVLAGISSSLLILSYPTCVLAVLPVVIGIFCVSEKPCRLLNSAVYMGTCACCGIAWLSYFLGHMSVFEFLYGLEQMCTDGSHSSSLLNKLTDYGRDLVKLAPHMLIAVVVACAIYLIGKNIVKCEWCSFFMCLLMGTCLEQCYVWVFKNYYLKFPLLFYFVLLGVGIFRYGKRHLSGAANNMVVDKAMFWFGSWTAVFIWFAALLASNTHIYESSEYMMVGFIASMGYMEYEHQKSCQWWRVVVIGLLGVALFRKGYFMYYTYGKDTVWVTKQKAVSGPLAGVYCRWSDGTNYNTNAEVIGQYVPRGSRVLLVSVENLIYLQGGYCVSNFSTISTPTYDERLYTYWEHYPEKYPEYIVWDTTISGLFVTDDTVKERIVGECRLVAEEGNWQIYVTGK